MLYLLQLQLVVISNSAVRPFLYDSERFNVYNLPLISLLVGSEQQLHLICSVINNRVVRPLFGTPPPPPLPGSPPCVMRFKLAVNPILMNKMASCYARNSQESQTWPFCVK